MVCAIVVIGIRGYSILNTAVSYISIDLNPSIELALNRFDNVIEASAYNDDGAAILESNILKGKSYIDAVDTLLSSDEFNSYINEESELNFTIVSDNKEKIIEGLQNCHGYGQYNSSCHEANSDIVSDAHSHGLSFGKYRAYLELSEYDSSITTDDCKDMTMRQIYDRISEYSVDDTSDGAGAHNGHGHGQHKRRHGR